MMNPTQQHSQSSGDHGSSASEEGGGLSAVNPKEIVSMVEGFARENPHAAILGGLAVGFLLGGGLTPRLLSTVAVIAGRKYLNETLRGTMQSVLREQLGGMPIA